MTFLRNSASLKVFIFAFGIYPTITFLAVLPQLQVYALCRGFQLTAGNYVTVARQKKIPRDVDGQRQFSHEEVLFSMQIQSFFSWRAKCENSEVQSVSDQDYEAAEEALATLRNVEEHIQPKNPVMYNGYNLCDFVTSQKLSKLKISKLKEIKSDITKE